MTPIHDRVIRINAEQSAQYIENESARKRYWAAHPTFFGCIKCMDGRVLFPTMTHTPVGIVKPFRAIGGKFHVWWPSFLGRVRHWVEKAIAQGSRSFLFVTYHYSASDSHLGCAGWSYDTKSARAHAEKLQKELTFVFGEQLTAVVAGVETDRDLFTLHGPNGDVSGEMLIGLSDDAARARIATAFPEMDLQTVKDVLPFMIGNAARVESLTTNPREHKELQHNERIIALGQGFEWLAQANLALIINDADPNLAESVKVAASLIEKNLKDAPKDDDATIFTCIPYHEPGLDQRQAVARSQGLQAFAKGVITAAYPELLKSGRLHALTAIMRESDKKIEVIDDAA